MPPKKLLDGARTDPGLTGVPEKHCGVAIVVCAPLGFRTQGVNETRRTCKYEQFLSGPLQASAKNVAMENLFLRIQPGWVGRLLADHGHIPEGPRTSVLSIDDRKSFDVLSSFPFL